MVDTPQTSHAVLPSSEKFSFFPNSSFLFPLPISLVPLEKYTKFLKGECSVLKYTTHRTVMQNNNTVSKASNHIGPVPTKCSRTQVILMH